ncbi:MAG: ferrous iron transport protein B [archaeon]
MRIALAGNPNSGKTSLFNRLTGMRQHVGNWPGKTVEKKEGEFSIDGKKIEVVDLPGTYSLTAYSDEELIARDYIIHDAPDVVVNVVDAANLERNLYLTVQFIELGANVVLALNMNKLARKRGIRINAKKLSYLLGIPVVKIEAVSGLGVSGLLRHSKLRKKREFRIHYGSELEDHIAQVEETLSQVKPDVPKRWLALKILENDRTAGEISKDSALVLGIREHLAAVFGEKVDAAIADARYGFIAGLCKEAVTRPEMDRVMLSDQIDRVILNKYAGIPIFLAIMYLMFQATFSLGNPVSGYIGLGVSLSADSARSLLASAPAWVSALVADAVIAGIGSVIVFLPNILLLFMIISLLEDSGYLARAAFLMDRFMHRIGLHGKSFLPLIMGFGCTVPAVMATRTLHSRQERLVTMLIAPCMSCGARLPVYVLFASAFFVANQGLVIFSLYVLGTAMALAMGYLFRKTLFRDSPSEFVMELPPYRMPTLTGTVIHMWEKAKYFLIKAGTLIFAALVVMWFLGSLPWGVAFGSADSLIGMIGKAIAPVFAPLGFGTWEAAVALIFGFVAKEAVVGTLGSLYGAGEEGLISVLSNTFTPLSAYSFMIFTLLYVPCIATIATIRREAGWRWALFAAGYLTALAWAAAFIFYQAGSYIRYLTW